MDMVVKKVSWTTPTVAAKYIRVRVKSDLNDGVASNPGSCTWLPCVPDGVGAPTGDFFVVLHEPGNRHDRHDRHTIAVYREEEPGTVVGHLPREISRTLALALKNAASKGWTV